MLAAEYDRCLEHSSVIRPEARPNSRHVYCLYTIRTGDRDRLQSELEGAGIQTAVHYPLPIHLMSAYADSRYKAGDLPIAERCAESVLSLPLYPQMKRQQVEEVAARICELRPQRVQETIHS